MYLVLFSALATLKPQAGITAGSYAAPAAPQPVSLYNKNFICTCLCLLSKVSQFFDHFQ
jgi:hypothetical protein